MSIFSQEQREERVNTLKAQGICPTCYDLRTGGAIFGNQGLIYEDEYFNVMLESRPRMRGHTIIVYKPHREDLSQLEAEEIAPLFQLCVSMTRALKQALQAEKVYLNTMCDGPLNHLHIQLFPRFSGEKIGSTRFVLPRQQLLDAEAIAQLIRVELLSILEAGK